MSADEFAGLGLALGSVRGARSFTVDKLGRLTGIHYTQVWRPGENEAECRKKDDPYSGLSMSFDSLYRSMYPSYSRTLSTTSAQPEPSWFRRYILGGSVQSPAPIATVLPQASKLDKPEPAPEPEKPAHNLETCSCGFYGYYDGSDDYHKKGTVSGVVEGYGETLIGTRGFRAMRARIVALRIPKSVPVRLAGLVARNYPEIPLFTSFKQMVEEFPTDAGDLSFSPDDEDFWTRSI